MVIYEVNLLIKLIIFDSYVIWLEKHIQSMIDHCGFLSARLCIDMEDNSPENMRKITIFYEIESISKLEYYFKTHAQTMRQEGLDTFGNNFSATRRTFEISNVFNSK